MINLELTLQEIKTISEALEEFYQTETDWLDACIKKDDNNENVINTAVNIRTTENILCRFASIRKGLNDE